LIDCTDGWQACDVIATKGCFCAISRCVRLTGLFCGRGTWQRAVFTVSVQIFR